MTTESWTPEEKKLLNRLRLSTTWSPKELAALVTLIDGGATPYALGKGKVPGAPHISEGTAEKIRNLARKGQLNWVLTSKLRKPGAIFDLVELPYVRSCELYPAVDVLAERVSCRLVPVPFHLSPPRNINGIIEKIVADKDLVEPGTPASDRRLEYYWERFRKGEFATEDKASGFGHSLGSMDVIEALLHDESVLEAAKQACIEAYLTMSEGFHFNGPFLALS